ncbi:RNA polymerase sigma factor, partial [Acidobacteriota bacterium]
MNSIIVRPTGSRGTMNEENWIRGAQKGDLTAFEQLVRAKRERIYWLAFRIIGNEEDAKDITQLVFIKLWKVIGQYRRKYPFDTWLYRIVVNLSIDYYRKEGQKRRLSTSIDEPESKVTLQSPQGQDLEMMLGEVSEIFAELAKELSPRQRAVFALKEIENRSTREVAKIMGLRQSTVRNHLFQA